MAFGHGKEARVLLNDIHVSGNVTGWSCGGGKELADITCLGASGHSWLPGLKYGRISLQGLFDAAAGSLHVETNSVLGTDDGALFTVLPSGGTLGQPAFICVSDIANYSVDSTVADAVKISIEPQPDDGVEWGVSLHALGAETADGNGASVDNAAATANGGVASLHVTAYSGLTDAVIKVQHSVDDSVWADLLTFTTVTTTTSQRSVIAAGTTVRRYLRYNIDVTGTGSVTFAVAFARR